MINLFFCLVFLCHLIYPSSSTVHLKSTSQSFVDSPARFTRRINGSRICGSLHLADPLDACSLLLDEAKYGDSEIARFALIVRGKCAFEEKIRNAQDAGFRAAVVYDDQHNHNLISMMGNPDGIWIPAVFVSNEVGETLREHAQAEENECCIISSLDETAWTVLVISFISLLVVVSLLATIFFTYNHRWNQQGTRHVIDNKVVDILPCITFDAAKLICNTGETCAICLEDYKDGECLKILPCQHVTIFHNLVCGDTGALQHKSPPLSGEVGRSPITENPYLLPNPYRQHLLEKGVWRACHVQLPLQSHVTRGSFHHH